MNSVLPLLLRALGHLNAVGTLDSVFADPDMEMLRAKMNELILNGRR